MLVKIGKNDIRNFALLMHRLMLSDNNNSRHSLIGEQLPAVVITTGS